ncbi:hypothetical protein JHK87_042986 [Glycine soja]|nr:hypothetical protein JHK87_042986 [Glycine soja]
MTGRMESLEADARSAQPVGASVRQTNRWMFEVVKESVNKFVDEHGEVGSEIFNVSFEWLKIGVSHVGATHEVYVSYDDMTYNVVNASSETYKARYDDIEDYVDGCNGDESDKLSDFEENTDVIDEVHSNDDINEIYVERGILGKPFERQVDDKMKFEKGEIVLECNSFLGNPK